MKSDETEEDSSFEADDLVKSTELDQEEVPETDITFECPHCGKSLSIDPRGAGLVISCTLCGQPVTVPIPEGLEIDDFDATPEELSIQLLSARQNLAKAQAHIAAMELELDELRAYRDSALHTTAAHKVLCEQIRVQLSEAARSQADATTHLREVATLLTASE